MTDKTDSSAFSALWPRYAGHRNQLMRRIRELHRSEPQTICILGAGSCADLDLQELGRMFAEIHLADIDLQKVCKGLAEQQADQLPGLVIHAPYDVTGVNERLAEWSEQSPAETEIEKLILQISSPPSLPGCYDLVVSACLMSQLFLPAKKCLISQEFRNRILFAVRKQHLLTLLAMTKPGGTALLVSDVAAFETEQDFSTAEDLELQETMLEMIRRKNFFTGTNPVAILNEIKRSPEISSAISELNYFPPWLWQMFEDRVYIVYAITLQKTPGTRLPK